MKEYNGKKVTIDELVGIATIVMALMTGSGVHVVTKLLCKVMVVRPGARPLPTWSSDLSFLLTVIG